MKVWQCQKYQRTFKNIEERSKIIILGSFPICHVVYGIGSWYHILSYKKYNEKTRTKIGQISWTQLFWCEFHLRVQRSLVKNIEKRPKNNKLIHFSGFAMHHSYWLSLFPFKISFLHFHCVTLELLKISTWWQRTN